MTFFGPSMTEKRGRIEGEENIRVFPDTVGGRGRAMLVSLVHAHAWVRGVGLTEPEQGVGL